MAKTYQKKFNAHSCTQEIRQNELIAPEFLKVVSDISGYIQEKGDCQTVDLIASKSLDGSPLSVFAQGTVFASKKEPEKLFILTAGHALSNATGADARCDGKTIPSKIRGVNQTQDLAVLEIANPPPSLKPVFVWDGGALPDIEARRKLGFMDKDYIGSGAYYLETSASLVVPSILRLIKSTPDGVRAISNRYFVKTRLTENPAEHPLIGSRGAILLESQGIRPGMSGSPILYQVMDPFDKKGDFSRTTLYFAGVVVKTYVNDTRSVAVPTETVSETLPSLMEGRDSSRDPSSPYYFEKAVFRTASGVSEIPEVVFPSEHGETRYRALCPGPYSNSSALGDAGKGGAGDGDGGKGGAGDGDGGKGGAGDGDDTKKLAQGGYYTSDFITLYRDRPACKETGIRDSQGNVFVAIRNDNGSVTKIESFEDISHVLQAQGRNFPGFLASHGIRAQSASKIYQSFCSDRSLFDSSGGPKRVRVEQREFNPSQPDLAHHISAIELPNGDHVFTGASTEVFCHAEEGSISVNVTKSGFSADLEISPEKWSGTIKFKGCEISFSETPKQLWRGSYQDGNMDLQMSLDPSDDFLHFDIFSLGSSCDTDQKYSLDLISVEPRPKGSVPVWLSKIGVSLPTGH